MNLKKLKELSGKRMLNMKALYERAHISVSSMNSRISTMSGQLSVDEAERLEIAAIETLGEVIETLDINKFKLANYLDLKLHEHSLKQGAGPVVKPYGYLNRKNAMPIPIFESSDKLKRREMRTGTSNPVFYDMDKIKNLVEYNPSFRTTDRGDHLLSTA